MIKKSDLAKIHIAKQQLGIDDDSYRMILQRIAGVSSAKDLTNIQVEKLLDEFKAKGWKPKKTSKTKGKPHNFEKLGEYIKKIEALLAEMKLSWTYADAICKQMFKIDKVAWLQKYSQLEAILVALDNKKEIDSWTAYINYCTQKLRYSVVKQNSMTRVRGKASEKIAALKVRAKRLDNEMIARGLA